MVVYTGKAKVVRLPGYAENLLDAPWGWYCMAKSGCYAAELTQTHQDAMNQATDHVHKMHLGSHHRQHHCDTGDMDRSPYACGVAHAYCSVCGASQDQCGSPA